jgi:hypothetical protein
MVFENGVKNIQAAAYNGARTVYMYIHVGVNFSARKLLENFVQKYEPVDF